MDQKLFRKNIAVNVQIPRYAVKLNCYTSERKRKKNRNEEKKLFTFIPTYFSLLKRKYFFMKVEQNKWMRYKLKDYHCQLQNKIYAIL